MKIRKAYANDIEAIKILWKQMMDFHFKYDTYFELNDNAINKYHDYLSGNLKDKNKIVYVATENNKIVGYTSAFIEEYPPIYLFEKYVMVNEICIDQNCRRKGIGKLLLNEIYKFAEKNNIQRIECQVAVKNHVSQNFWQKNNFIPYIHNMYKELQYGKY